VTILRNQLKTCLEDIDNIHKRLEEKQAEEEERDDVVAAQVDDVRASLAKAQEEIGSRLGNLESDLQKQRAEDLDRA
jgi:DNA repair exonuclease SbcCD ATPase subunit